MNEDNQKLLAELKAEFEQKKHYQSVYEAYTDKREAAKMYKKFKDAGIVIKSWRRSCGLLKTSDNLKYRKQWRSENKDKCLQYNFTWLTKKMMDSQNTK
jgi:hypothetical protein